MRATRAGLSVSSIADRASYALHGGLTNEFWRMPSLRQNTILVRCQQDERAVLTPRPQAKADRLMESATVRDLS